MTMRFAKKLSLGWYLVSTGVSAALMGFVIVVLLGMTLQDGETAIDIALTWFGSLPFVALVSLAAMATHSKYSRLKTWKQTLPFFASQSVVVAVLAWILTYGLDSFGLLEPLFEAMG
jgi:hypothetical protein